ncbi:MAG: hypothetical protein AVDCRST_MAG33-2552 [uncultured Thermomicrobiales bacterium]|uniref:Uncharacterized protein n=1 Tax=uncultured Thermomicrobiales bacterium TaxID=1645740 RepID=A0A6J4VBT1_9BACT|nr:MAG: hypothetical protein AVDCRST_MAG33-2552 [uncultured Thermomicrobiales bacterium]
MGQSTGSRAGPTSGAGGHPVCVGPADSAPVAPGPQLVPAQGG